MGWQICHESNKSEEGHIEHRLFWSLSINKCVNIVSNNKKGGTYIKTLTNVALGNHKYLHHGQIVMRPGEF